MKKLFLIFCLLQTSCQALNTRPPEEIVRKPMLHEQMRSIIWQQDQASPDFLFNVGNGVGR